MRRAAGWWTLHGALVAGSVLTLAPLVWMVSASLMPTGEATSIPVRFIPSRVTLEHYRELFTRLDFARNLWNSALIAGLATLGALVVTSTAGYALAKLRFTGRDRVFRGLLALMVIPGQVVMLPLFLLLQSMGLVNSFAGVILPSLAGIYLIFLVRQYALGIPDELLDAARVDGASELRIFVFVVLPLLRPILATQAVFTFLGAWNDFLWPLIMLTDDRRYTLPVALASVVGEHVQDTELMMAGSVLTVLPVFLVFLALQRAYMRGILMGSVKG